MIFKIKDFEFENYNHDGDSGQKYIATRKSDGKKFIVKHEYPDSACNEFVYFSIAKLLEIKTLEFYLFENDECNEFFKSGYAIAIEYIDATKLKSIAKQKYEIKNWQDYFRHLALRTAFFEGDSFEFLIDQDNYLYRIDTTDSFCLNCYLLAGGIEHSYKKYLSNIENLKLSNLIFKFLSRTGNKIKEVGSDIEYRIFRITLELLWAIPQVKWEPFLNELCKVFPNEIGICYISYLKKCQEACNRYLNEEKI